MKILFVSSVPPCTGYAAGLVLKHIIQNLPENSCVCAALVNPYLPDTMMDDDLNIPFLRLVQLQDGGCQKKFLFHWMASLVGRWYELRRRRNSRKDIRDLVEFAKKHDVDRIFVLLETPVLITIAPLLASASGLDLYTAVFDPPDLFLKMYNYDKKTCEEVRKFYGNAISISKNVAVVSDSMGREFMENYAAKTTVFRYPLPASFAAHDTDSYPDSSDLVIGMSGQIYALDAWGALIDFLNSRNWKISGRKVVFRYMGRRLEIATDSRCNIEFLGWIDQKESIRELSKCHILYCPYAFDDTFMNLAKYSFPSKITAYMAAGRPVFFHGPPYSSPVPFIEENRCGIVCTSLDRAEISKAFEIILESNHDALCRNARATFHKYFASDIASRVLRDFFDIAPE